MVMNRSVLLTLAAVGFLYPVCAQEAPGRIDLNDPNLVIVEASVIPIPLEIFSSLDKLGTQDWSKHVDEREIRLDANRSRTAMLFGLVVSLFMHKLKKLGILIRQ